MSKQFKMCESAKRLMRELCSGKVCIPVPPEQRQKAATANRRQEQQVAVMEPMLAR